MPKITTTMQPSKEIEVSPAEARNLRRMGILATVDGEKVTKKSEKPATTRGGSGDSSTPSGSDKKKEG